MARRLSNVQLRDVRVSTGSMRNKNQKQNITATLTRAANQYASAEMLIPAPVRDSSPAMAGPH